MTADLERLLAEAEERADGMVAMRLDRELLRRLVKAIRESEERAAHWETCNATASDDFDRLRTAYVEAIAPGNGNTEVGRILRDPTRAAEFVRELKASYTGEIAALRANLQVASRALVEVRSLFTPPGFDYGSPACQRMLAAVDAALSRPGVQEAAKGGGDGE